VPRSIHVVVGGLFGSESKGRVSASIVTRLMTNAPDAHVTCIRVAGPNAGHVVWAIPPKDLVDADVANNPAPPPMQRFAMRQIPVGFVHPHVRLYIAPGSEVSVAVLESEIHELETAGFQIRDRLYISPQATILDNTHMQRETDLVKSIGSTGKGIGACRADRLMRIARLVRDNEIIQGLLPAANIRELHEEINRDSNEHVVIEGTQGYGLGLHSGYYPKVTSSDCRAVDFLAMSGVTPWAAPEPDLQIHVVIRPYPIRVAGDSGPLIGETTWENLGLPAEKTTVTQKIRRVGQFDPELVTRAIEANGTNRVSLHLAMADQVVPEVKYMDSPTDIHSLSDENRKKLLDFLVSIPHHAKLRSLGTGPATQIWLSAGEVNRMLKLNPNTMMSTL
jgi:adenylosuccinate synthase